MPCVSEQRTKTWLPARERQHSALLYWVCKDSLERVPLLPVSEGVASNFWRQRKLELNARGEDMSCPHQNRWAGIESEDTALRHVPANSPGFRSELKTGSAWSEHTKVASIQRCGRRTRWVHLVPGKCGRLQHLLNIACAALLLAKGVGSINIHDGLEDIPPSSSPSVDPTKHFEDHFRSDVHQDPTGRLSRVDTYPGALNSGSAGAQTVDDLVYNHFLIHSLGGGGWWWGGRSSSSFANVGGEDPVCSLHHKTIRAKQKDHNVTRTETCARSHGGMLWRGRYLFADKVQVAEDASTALRAAKDYQSEPLPGALVFVKFFRDLEQLESERSLLAWVEQEKPGVVTKALESFELHGEQIVDQRRRFVLVLEGGSPLSDVVASNDHGNGISRDVAVSMLTGAATALALLSQLGLEVAALSGSTLMRQDDGQVKVFDVSSVVTVAGRGAASAAVHKALAEAPLCLPEKSFSIGDSGVVWAYKNVVYLMMPRPGNVLFGCGRVTDDNVQRSSLTLQTTRLYVIQIRVQSGPAWLPDPAWTAPG